MGESHRRSGTPPTLTAGAAIVLLLVGAAAATPEPQASNTAPTAPRADEPGSAEGATPVVRVSVELVQVDVAVTDRAGRRVLGLRPEDFEIREDGRPQVVTHLFYVTQTGPAPAVGPGPAVGRGNPPVPVGEPAGRWLVLVVDDLGMSFEGIAQVRAALRRMVETQLEAADHVALILSSGGRGSAEAFTSDRGALLEAVESVRWGRGVLSTASMQEGTPTWLGKATDEEAKAALANAARADYVGRRTGGALGALRLTLQALLRVPGRKALVFFAEGLDFQAVSPGEIPAQLLELWPLTELANRASTVIYAVDPQGVGGGLIPGGDAEAMGPAAGHAGAAYWRSRQPLYDLARDTGGLFLPSNDMVASLGRAAEDQRGYYLLGYAPPPAAFDAGSHGARYHRIQVRVKRPGLKVRSRAGYYGVADRTVSKVDTLLRALETPLSPGQMGLRVTALADADDARRPLVRIFLHVDGSAVNLTDREEGGAEATLEMLLVAVDSAGRTVGEAARRLVIPVPAGAERRARREGFVYATTLPVRRDGEYHVRAAIRDASTGSTGSAFTFVDVPDFRAGRLALSGLAVGSDPAAVTGSEAAGPLPEVTPAVRIVPRGSSLRYALRVFGAHAGGRSVHPRIATTTELLREGRVIFTSAEVPVEAGVDGPGSAIAVGGRLQLPSGLEPGSYVVRVVVREVAASAPTGRAAQSIDFDLR